MISPDEQAKWKARGALDEMKKEIGVDKFIGPLTYPEWDELQKYIKK